ncbi:hypothetical protein RV02_GL001230 [Enterococcus gilvus]|nr:hypothetical protein RV02_GL001230 [Enterococcus gilvus]
MLGAWSFLSDFLEHHAVGMVKNRKNINDQVLSMVVFHYFSVNHVQSMAFSESFISSPCL